MYTGDVGSPDYTTCVVLDDKCKREVKIKTTNTTFSVLHIFVWFSSNDTDYTHLPHDHCNPVAIMDISFTEIPDVDSEAKVHRVILGNWSIVVDPDTNDLIFKYNIVDGDSPLARYRLLVPTEEISKVITNEDYTP